MARRAQLGIQFNWLFVLIIGAIILAFFITLINNQQEKAGAEEATDLVESLDTVFTVINTEPDTYDAFPIPDAEVEFTCEPGLSQYYIQGAGPIDTTYDPIFTPDVLRGDTIMSWTMTWGIPFEVAVLTFLANDRTLFVFASDEQDGFVKAMADELPEQFPRQTTSVSNIGGALLERGYSRYVVITDKAVKSMVPTELWDVTYVRHINPLGNGIDSYGQIKFYDASTREVTEPYFTEALAWGAVFAQDADAYRCAANKTLIHLQVISTILERRARAIAQELGALSFCYDNFLLVADSFQDFADDPSFDKARTFHSHRQTIENYQKISLRGYRCPDLY
ncbi:hypothetical protein GF367_02890 [Candidatus Woesearchaeota archaeon]|nr:hypothetical protein [Candidatus Woesearchaeota archaeon]